MLRTSYSKSTFHGCQIEEQGEEEINEDISLLHTSQIEDPSQTSQLKSKSVESGGMGNAIKKSVEKLKNQQFIEIHEKLITPTKLGLACISAGMAPGDALKIYDDLENAKCGLNLETDFHLIYLCTPLNINDNPHMETLADKLLHLNRLVLPLMYLTCRRIAFV